jgi:hypothetical protein
MRGVLFLAFLMVACGGGAGSSNLVAIPQTGQIAVRMTQQAGGETNGIYVTFCKISMVPKDGGEPVVLFEDLDGEEVNISNLSNEVLLLSVNDDVPTGTYTKLLVDVKAIDVVGGPCDDLDTSVPDDEIELLPDEEIEVKAGDKLAITLAMNSDQSVQLKADAVNEECVFLPVVKVEVETLSPPEAQKCPTSAAGEVTEILLNIQNEILGFVLDLGAGSDPQNVLIDDDTGMFGINGLPTSPETIDLGDELTAKGRLNEDGDMLADVITVGEQITFGGTVLSMPELGVVRVLPDEGEEVVGETNVRIFDATLILFDCQDATIASLTRGAKVTIGGKVAPDRSTFLASEVEVDPVVIFGLLTSCKEVTDGFEITVLPIGVRIEQTIFVPEEVGILLQGDGTIPKDLLEELLECDPLPVKVALASDDLDAEPTLAQTEDDKKVASEVRVAAETIKGKVERIAPDDRLVLVDETLVSVLRTATIIDLRKDEKLGSLEDIDIGDCVRVFGLSACEDDLDADFYGFVLVVLPDEKPEPPKPDRYEGCSHGFWKNHEEAWPRGYSPDDLFDDLFEPTFEGKTLMDVLRIKGGGINSLGRETVAALLNAASDHVNYRYTERGVIGMFNETSPRGEVEWLKKRFEYNNNLGCPWDGKDDDRYEDDEKKDKRGKKDR